MYILDTSICVHIIRGRTDGGVRALRRLTSCDVGDVALSAITVAELEYGVAKSRYATLGRERLDGFLQPLQIVAFDDTAALAYGELRAYLEGRGEMIGGMDLQIAAQAVAVGAVLVTSNVTEFARVPRLRVENWAV